MSVSGQNFFGLSSEYRKGQIDEFFYLNKLMGVGWGDFEKMTLFVRQYLLDKWIEENQKD